LANDKLRQRYLQYVRQIAAESLKWSSLGVEVAEAKELLQDSVKRDTRKLMTTEAFLNAMTSDVGQQGVPSLREFADERAKYLLGHDAIKNLPTEPVLVASSVSPYRAKIAVAKLPHQDSTVVINEAMASNASTVKDLQGEFDDWVELHNRGKEPVDLSGMYLTDDADHARKWKFPAGTSIAPNGYLLIWADNDDKSHDGLHANFKLSKEGELLALVSELGVLGTFRFPTQADDVSYGWVDGKMQVLKPSPGKANQAP